MAYEDRGMDISFKADEAIPQYRLVILDATSGKVRLPDSASEYAIGITQDAAEAEDDVVNVRVSGVSKLTVNDAVSVNDFLMPEYVAADDAGKGDDATGNEEYAKAQVIGSASAEDELATVLILSSNPS